MREEVGVQKGNRMIKHVLCARQKIISTFPCIKPKIMCFIRLQELLEKREKPERQ